MEQQTRILEFYSELLCEAAGWARTQADGPLAAHGEALYRELSQGRRTVPQESLFALRGALPAFADDAPHRRTVVTHLDKYLDTLQAAAQE